MGGAFFEGLIVNEAVKVFTNLGRKPDLFFWRSHDGLKVDLIIQIHGKLYPVEIKMTSSPTLQHLDPLNKFKKIVGEDEAQVGVLVCRAVKKIILSNSNTILPWHEFSGWLLDRLTQ
jgi:predicted AAA+ superfamily ATPase